MLKPYFEKALRAKNISVKIYAEVENGQLLSQSATSEDTSKINREVIEGVRFRFVDKTIFGKTFPGKQENTPGATQLQSAHPLYESGEELLEDILKHTEFKHHQQLRYLAEKHAGNILKVRFVLHPFSFVFLLEGKEQFHIILETLDTEEASYLWYLEKSIPALPACLKEIDRHLDLIRKQGR